MLHREDFRTEDGAFVRTYSDKYMIRKAGTEDIYSEAIDLPDSAFVYEETEIELDGYGLD